MLIGEKVDLHAVERGDLPLFLKWVNDPEVTEWLKIDPPYNMEMEEQWFDGVNKRGALVFTIQTKDGVKIGNIGLESISWRNRHAMIGIMIGEKGYWSRGYGTDAMLTLLRYCFEELGMVRVELFTDTDNIRAQKAYEKCGFVREGVMRKYRFKSGRYVDDVIMAILDEDWFAKHPSGR